jgi:hypothetical protein
MADSRRHRVATRLCRDPFTRVDLDRRDDGMNIARVRVLGSLEEVLGLRTGDQQLTRVGPKKSRVGLASSAPRSTL